MAELNPEVTALVAAMNHPQAEAIHSLRRLVLSAHPGLSENVKWNGPNYSVGAEDCITMRVNPPGKIQLIFHRGAKVKAQPASRLIADESGLLSWKENDRAILTITRQSEIASHEKSIGNIVHAWVEAAKES